MVPPYLVIGMPGTVVSKAFSLNNGSVKFKKYFHILHVTELIMN